MFWCPHCHAQYPAIPKTFVCGQCRKSFTEKHWLKKSPFTGVKAKGIHGGGAPLKKSKRVEEES